MSDAAITQLDRINRWIVKHKLATSAAQFEAERHVFDGFARDVLPRILAVRVAFRHLEPAQREDLAQEALFRILLALRRCNFYFASWRILTLYLHYAQSATRAAHPIGDLVEMAMAPRHDDAEPDTDNSYTVDDLERTKRQVRAVLADPPIRREIFQRSAQGQKRKRIADELSRPYRDHRCIVVGTGPNGVRIARPTGGPGESTIVDSTEIRNRTCRGSQVTATRVGIRDEWERIRADLRAVEANPWLRDRAVLDVALELLDERAPTAPESGPPFDADTSRPDERSNRENSLSKAELLSRVLQHAVERPELQAVAHCLAACLSPDETERVLGARESRGPGFQALIDDLARIIGNVCNAEREGLADASLDDSSCPSG